MTMLEDKQMSTEYLVSTDDSAKALKRISAVAWQKRSRLGTKLQFDFAHGQWWVTNLRTGTQWSVYDVYPDDVDFDFVETA